jgi:hypothetical protein
MRAVPYFLPVRAAPKKPKNCRAEMRAMTKSRLQQCSTAEPAQGLVRDQASQSLGTDEASQALAAAAEMQPRDPPSRWNEPTRFAFRLLEWTGSHSRSVQQTKPSGRNTSKEVPKGQSR